MNDKNRVFYFMGGTLLVALLIIGVMYLSGNRKSTTSTSKKDVVLSSDPTVDIKKAILDINSANASGEKYSTAVTMISAARNQNLINNALQESLQLQLDNQYRNAAISKIDRLIKSDPINIAEINTLISHMKSIGINDPKFASYQSQIAFYQSQIAKMNYYTTSLPAKVNAFTSRSFANYDHDSYKALINEIETLPGLDPLFKKKNAVAAMQGSLIRKMRDYNAKYADYQMSLNNINVDLN